MGSSVIGQLCREYISFRERQGPVCGITGLRSLGAREGASLTGGEMGYEMGVTKTKGEFENKVYH